MQDWIERYVYAVGGKLPKGQRGDIEKELHSLILDALDEKVAGKKEKYGEDYTATEEDVLEVLKAFGSPREVANNYMSQRRYLIGPELFDTYTMVLKIVLTAVALGLGVATLVSIVVAEAPVLESLVQLPLRLFSGAISAVGAITIVFALIQYYGSEQTLADAREKEEWHVRDLPPVPLPANRLKRSSIIAEISFMVVAIVAINFFLDYFAVFFLEQGEATFIPLFNMEVVRGYLPYFNGLLLLGITLSAYKLKRGQLSKGIRAGTVVLSLAGALIFVLFATNEAIFNPELSEPLLAVTTLGIRLVIAIVILAAAYDIISHLVTMFK